MTTLAVTASLPQSETVIIRAGVSGVLIGMVTEYLLAYGDERRYRCHLRQRASPSVAAGQTFNQRPTNQQGKTLKKSLANVITM